jgi:TetR/AcrR family transcriptional regulator, transcriptional repressor for nem operon
MGRASVRGDIVETGLRVMFQTGYVGSSVRDIVAAAGVPQGSFTNHFPSKEQFACEVLERYFDHVKALMHQSLGDRTLAPRDRLVRYLDIITARLKADGWNRGCLIGDLSLEAPGHSERIRRRLAEIYREWRAPFADCLAQAQAAGEIDARFTPMDLAEFLLASWEGAILRMKVERDPAPLDRFRRIAFATVFATPTPRPSSIARTRAGTRRRVRRATSRQSTGAKR